MSYVLLLYQVCCLLKKKRGKVPELISTITNDRPFGVSTVFKPNIVTVERTNNGILLERRTDIGNGNASVSVFVECTGL